LLTKRAVVAQSVGLLFGQVFDWYTTVLGMRLGAIEQNPVVAWVFAQYGTLGALAFKVGVGFLLAYYTREKPVWAWTIVLVFIAVGCWNLSVISRLL
jgi:hypothetical protein